MKSQKEQFNSGSTKSVIGGGSRALVTGGRSWRWNASNSRIEGKKRKTSGPSPNSAKISYKPLPGVFSMMGRKGGGIITKRADPSVLLRGGALKSEKRKL